MSIHETKSCETEALPIPLGWAPHGNMRTSRLNPRFRAGAAKSAKLLDLITTSPSVLIGPSELRDQPRPIQLRRVDSSINSQAV